MNELLVKANEEVKKVADYLKENEDMFDMMDLKLHNVSFFDYEKDFPLCYKDDEENTNGYTNFYYFCEDNYNMFVEDLKEDFNIDFDKMRKQVGRTSSFYLVDWIEITYGKINVENTINTLLCDKYVYNLNYTEVNDNGIIIPYGEYTEEDEEVQEELENIVGFYDWFIEETQDIKTVYDMIKNFKDNQVEYFKDYLRYEEERLQSDIDEEIEEENQKEEIANQIKDKYNISNEDMEILKSNI